MKDMFFNYDHNINKKECQEIHWYNKPLKNMVGYSDLQVVTNIKGDLIGVSVFKNNPIKLYFYIDGDIDGNFDIDDKLSNITFEIIDKNEEHKVRITKEVICKNGEIIVYIPAEENILEQDIYKLKLTAIIEDEPHTLFAEQDAFLEVR